MARTVKVRLSGKDCSTRPRGCAWPLKEAAPAGDSEAACRGRRSCLVAPATYPHPAPIQALVVCTENVIRVDDVMELPKLAE